MSRSLFIALTALAPTFALAEDPAQDAPAETAEAAAPEQAPAEEAPPEEAPVEEAPVEEIQEWKGLDEEEPPPPPVVLQEIPPRKSWDFGASAGVTSQYMFNDPGPWISFAIQGAYGGHVRGHRLGLGWRIALEGEVLAKWNEALGLGFQWDYVSRRKFWIGSWIGFDNMLIHDMLRYTKAQLNYGIAPAASLRIGYSGAFNRMARRFYVGIEPRYRYVIPVGADSDHPTNPLQAAHEWGVSLILGLGRGK